MQTSTEDIHFLHSFLENLVRKGLDYQAAPLSILQMAMFDSVYSNLEHVNWLLPSTSILGDLK